MHFKIMVSYNLVNDSYGNVIRFKVAGVNLSDFKATESETALIVTDTLNQPFYITESFVIETDSFTDPTGFVLWTVPKDATIGDSTPFKYEGIYQCQLEFINISRNAIESATKHVRSVVFNINNKHTIGDD